MAETGGAAVPSALETLLAGAPVDDADPAHLAAWTGARAEGVWRLAAAQAALLQERDLARLYETLEVPLVPILADLEQIGIRADPDRLGQLAKELDTQLDALLREIHELAGEAVNPNSPKQLAVVLFEKLKLPPVKRTKTGYSTDVDVLEELALGHALPGKILEYRQLAKLKGTYADALPALIHPRTGRIHTSFNQLVAATGRLSSSNPNLQNIPIRTELGRRIRQAFIPRSGLASRGRGLLADRAADPGALHGGAGAGRGVPAGRGHPHADRRADHARRGRRGHGRDARASPRS